MARRDSCGSFYKPQERPVISESACFLCSVRGLMTELLRREYLQTNTIHLKAFYVRRSLRIWPLYFTVLLYSGGSRLVCSILSYGSKATDRVRAIRRGIGTLSQTHCRPERAKLAVEHFSGGAILYSVADDR